MYFLNIATVFVVLLLTGVEFSVSAFVNRSAWRLAPEPQREMLSHFAALMGRVMPIWYAACVLLLGTETFLHRHTQDFGALLATLTVFLAASVASVVFQVPLNQQVAEGVAGWQQIHRTWDGRHRVRVAVLAIVGGLLTHVLVR